MPFDPDDIQPCCFALKFSLKFVLVQLEHMHLLILVDFVHFKLASNSYQNICFAIVLILRLMDLRLILNNRSNLSLSDIKNILINSLPLHE